MTKKRYLSALLAFCFLLTLFPASALAAEEKRPVAPLRQIDSGGCGIDQISDYHAAVDANGDLWMWGTNNYGELGDGTTTARSAPVKILDNVSGVSLGGHHSAALRTDGSLWMWGRNNCGQLGDSTTTDRSAPVKILDDVSSISLGVHHSAALKTDGSLWTWGYNHKGQLGDGTTTDRSAPVKVLDNVSVVSLGGWHSTAIKTDGSLWIWGVNDAGRLGDGTTTDRSAPVKLLDNVSAVSLGGYHSAALKTDGSLWMWGYNGCGQLGDGKTANLLTPAKIFDNISGVSLGMCHSSIIRADGSLWIWGGVSLGASLSNTPVKIADKVLSANAGYKSGLFVADDASLWQYTVDGIPPSKTEIEVISPLPGIYLDNESLTLPVNATATLTTTIYPASNRNSALVWVSSDPDVATVENGLVTAKGAGEADITVMAAKTGDTAVCHVTVPAPLTLDKDAVTLRVGNTLRLTPTVSRADGEETGVAWFSTAPAVASVSEDGVVSALAGGTATVSVVTLDGAYKADCVVTVPKEVSGVWLDRDSVTMKPGDSVTLTATVVPEDAVEQDVRWISSAPGVATVSNGLVKAWSVGKTTVTAATASGGFTASCAVNVTESGTETPTYTITFDPNGGTVAQTRKTVTRGQPYGDLPAPARTDYKFDGWFTAANGGTEITKDTTVNLSDAQTLYAHWELSAKTGTCGENLNWKLSDGALTISGTGEMENYWSDNRPQWYEYREQIERVEILEGVASIGTIAFNGCHKITEISIPDSVSAMGYEPMGYCGSLTAINVSGGNAHFASVNGVLYNKDKTRLIRCPEGLTGSFEIPSGVAELTGQAFCYSKFTDVTIPDGVTAIRNQAFGYSYQLSSVRIPTSVKEIERWVFGGCDNLSDIWYAGTEEQWKAIKISDDNNAPLFSATTHFNEQKQIPGLAELTYSFGNSASGLGYPTPYRIPYERYKMIFGDTVAAQWYFKASGDWGGDCYGFSTTAAMFSQNGGGVSTDAFRSGATRPAQLRTDDKNAQLGVTTREFLEAMQVSQNAPLIQRAYQNNKNKLNELCAAADAYQKTGKNPVLVAVFGKQGGHALLAYKLEQNRLYVYDCNYPNTERYVTLMTDANGDYVGWYYRLNDAYDWGSAYKGSWISFVPYADFLSVWNDRERKFNASTELLTVNADVVLKDFSGVPIASLEDGELITMQPDIYPLVEIGLTSDGAAPDKDTVSIWIPVGIYDLERTGDYVRANGEITLMDAENPFEASVTHVDQSADVSTTADKFSFIVDDESELNRVMFYGDAAEGAYDVTFRSTLTGAQQDARIVGNVSSQPLTFGMVNGQAVADEASMLSIEAYFLNGDRVDTKNVSGDTTVLVTFSPNGGSGSMPPRKVADDGQFTFPKCDFTAPSANGTFTGWLFDGKVYQSGDTVTLTADATAVAQWSGYGIGDVNADGNDVTVRLFSAVEQSVSVAVCAYSDGDKMLASAVRTVNGAASANVTLNTTGAACLKAFLLDPQTNAPLCEPFRKDLK